MSVIGPTSEPKRNSKTSLVDVIVALTPVVGAIKSLKDVEQGKPTILGYDAKPSMVYLYSTYHFLTLTFLNEVVVPRVYHLVERLFQ